MSIMVSRESFPDFLPSYSPTSFNFSQRCVCFPDYEVGGIIFKVLSSNFSPQKKNQGPYRGKQSSHGFSFLFIFYFSYCLPIPSFCSCHTVCPTDPITYQPDSLSKPFLCSSWDALSRWLAHSFFFLILYLAYFLPSPRKKEAG